MSLLRKLSLRGRLLLVLSLVAFGVALLVLALLPGRMADAAEHWSERKALTVAQLLAASLDPALDFGDDDFARERLELLSATPRALYGVVYDDRGEVLAKWPETLELPAPGTPGVPWRDERGLHVRYLFKSRNGEAGSVQLGFGESELVQDMRAVWRQSAFFAGLVLLLGLLLAFVIAQVLLRPVRTLTDIATRISDGDYAARERLDPTRSDELGQLGNAMDRMLARIFEEKDRVRALNQELEESVALRTAELALTNAELAARLGELKAAQEQLVAADRQVSLGQLAAGVAHEINNPLAYVSSNLQFVRKELVTAGPRAERDWLEAIDEAVEGCQRVRFIVQSLKAFSRSDEETLEPVSVEEALDAALQLGQNEIKHRARLVKQVDDVPRVMGNAVRLGQVFLNLLINAAHAIDPGASEKNRITLRVFRAADGRVGVSVSDTGCGMTEEVRLRLFTPFFTTKPIGQGTGLGLPICQGIVSRLGGEIRVESALGQGSTFTVLLPAALGDAPAASEEDDSTVITELTAVIRPPDRARILLVDDDALVARALKRGLSRNHEVDVASGGAAALELLERGERYDLILCDVMMPEMTGMELFETLRQRWPQVADRVVFVSGGAFTPNAQAFLEDHRDRVLDKPIDPKALQACIRLALDRGPALSA